MFITERWFSHQTSKIPNQYLGFCSTQGHCILRYLEHYCLYYVYCKLPGLVNKYHTSTPKIYSWLATIISRYNLIVQVPPFPTRRIASDKFVLCLISSYLDLWSLTFGLWPLTSDLDLQVVKLMKESPGCPTTAAIGDGANDVSMIQEAHVGLGKSGLSLQSGYQTVQATLVEINFHVPLEMNSHAVITLSTMFFVCFFHSLKLPG